MKTLLSFIALFIGTYCYGGSDETVYLFQNLTKNQIVAETVHILALEDLPFKSLEEGITIIMPDNYDEIFLKVSPHKYNRTVRLTIEYANQAKASIELISRITSKLKELDAPPPGYEDTASFLGKHAAEPRNGDSPKKKVAKKSDPEWNDHEHQDFVRVVFEQGLKAASPAQIMEQMIIMHKYPALNGERVKSHLQKYRKDPEKQANAFMQEYVQVMRAQKLSIPIDNDSLGTSNLIGAGGVAYVTQKTQNDGKPRICRDQECINFLQKMTEAEKSTPLGQTIEDTLKLFRSFQYQIYANRQNQVNRLPPISEEEQFSEEQYQRLLDEFSTDACEDETNTSFKEGFKE